MSDNNREPQQKRKRLSLGGLFYHNTFVLAFSFCAAIIIWFVMMAGSDTNRTVILYDVPIEVSLSEAATTDGIRVFNQSYATADLEIAGSSIITNKLTADDFSVTALLSPTSTKLTGNTLQKDSLQVRAAKTSTLSDYTIVSINPEEITVEYDRYKEATFKLETDLKYSADTGFYPGTPALSAEQVIVSGAESSVNKVSRAVVSYSFDDPLRADTSVSCPVRLFDQNNQEITDLTGLYISLDVETVEVNIPVLARKTVTVKASTLHQPKGFSDSRITVEPAQIDIAGTEEALAAINEITLDTPIDFAELDVSDNKSITMDIPLPSGVKDISATGENTVSQATVSVNLNGYQKASVSVPSANFQLSNQPAGKEVTFNTKTLDVAVIGSTAQTAKLTGDALSVQIDLANFANLTGVVDVPVTISITGSGSDSCWVFGKYTVSLLIEDADSENTMGRTAVQSDESSEALAAQPQE